jgi:hypothetical protein
MAKYTSNRANDIKTQEIHKEHYRVTIDGVVLGEFSGHLAYLAANSLAAALKATILSICNAFEEE